MIVKNILKPFQTFLFMSLKLRCSSLNLNFLYPYRMVDWLILNLYLNPNLNLSLIPSTNNQLYNFTQFRILSPTIKII